MSSTTSVAPSAARSSLEEMLELLKRKDEKPKDVPPALPARPTLKGRLPSSKRPRSSSIKIENNGLEYQLKESTKRDEGGVSKDAVTKSGSFGTGAMVKLDQPDAATHGKMPELESYEETSGDISGSDSLIAPSPLKGWVDDTFGWVDTIDSVPRKDSVYEQPQVQDSNIMELESRVLKAESELRQKEEENGALQQQLQQLEMRLLDYEATMKSKDEAWHKEVTSLQSSLDAAQKSLADVSIQHDQLPKPPTHGSQNAIGHLVEEFEQKTRAFEDEVRSVARPGSSVNPIEEIRKLKVRFAAWNKDYRIRLREAKAAAWKLGGREGEKKRRKWWCKK